MTDEAFEQIDVGIAIHVPAHLLVEPGPIHIADVIPIRGAGSKGKSQNRAHQKENEEEQGMNRVSSVRYPHPVLGRIHSTTQSGSIFPRKRESSPRNAASG